LLILLLKKEWGGMTSKRHDLAVQQEVVRAQVPRCFCRKTSACNIYAHREGGKEISKASQRTKEKKTHIAHK
jgi:hypothetical protein